MCHHSTIVHSMDTSFVISVNCICENFAVLKVSTSCADIIANPFSTIPAFWWDIVSNAFMYPSPAILKITFIFSLGLITIGTTIQLATWYLGEEINGPRQRKVVYYLSYLDFLRIRRARISTRTRKPGVLTFNTRKPKAHCLLLR